MIIYDKAMDKSSVKISSAQFPNLFRWFRGQKRVGSDGSCPHGNKNNNTTCRSCMKLPPIPHKVLQDLQNDSRFGHIRSNLSSPEHIYEEIPLSSVDGESLVEGQTDLELETSLNEPHGQMHSKPIQPSGPGDDNDRQVSLGNLDFGSAKEFGGFLVVPLRDRMVFQRLPEGNKSGPSMAHDHMPKSNIEDETKFQFHKYHEIDPNHVRKTLYVQQQCCPHNATASGGKNNGKHKEFVHCKKCSRPHGMYNGRSYHHFGATPSPSADSRSQPTPVLDSPRPPFMGYPDINHHLVPPNPHPSHISSSSQSVSSKEVSDGDNKQTNKQNTSGDTSSVFSDTEYDYQVSSADSEQMSPQNNNSNDNRFKAGANVSGMGSDVSNDTFSEYDATHNDVNYEYYLQRVEQNLSLKHEVKMISDSESSSCDRTVDGQRCSSVSSVLSLSEMSTSTIEKIVSLITKAEPEPPLAEEKVNPPTQRHQKKSKRKQSKQKQKKPLEYYKLPEFGTNTYSAPAVEAPVPSASHDDDNPAESSSSQQEEDSDSRLSLRVSTLKPSDLQTIRKKISKNENNPKENGVTETSMNPHTRARNKLLTDLMRKNHDRQLFQM